MKDTCKYIKAYKGIHKPRCCSGQGCKACWAKYFARRVGKFKFY